MRRVLITGMSGVGKSTVAERLSELGFKVVETDYGGFSLVDEHGHQHWDVDRVRELLATEDADVLFVVGSDDAQEILADLETFEPLMRRVATHEIDTSKPLDRVIDEILGLIRQPPPP